MDLYELMMREHKRLDLDLGRCIEASETARESRLDVRTTRRVLHYLGAQERALWPALVAICSTAAREPMLDHFKLRVRAEDALARCRRRDELADLALRRLRQELVRHSVREQTTLRACLGSAFTGSEILELSGAMRAELALARRGAVAAAKPPRQRSLPVLQDATLVAVPAASA